MQTSAILLEAIARRKCVAARYNRSMVRLAPHILYTRNDALFVDAVTVGRDGFPPREIKIGSFKVDGLSEVELEDQSFEAAPIFDPTEARYLDTVLFSVEN